MRETKVEKLNFGCRVQKPRLILKFEIRFKKSSSKRQLSQIGSGKNISIPVGGQLKKKIQHLTTV